MNDRVDVIRRGFVLLVLISATGCTSPPPSLQADWGILVGEPRGTLLSDNIALIADNQLHNIYSDPVKMYRTANTDKLISTSIRSALLDFYGQDVLHYVVAEELEDLPIVHLGDACDFSCTGEFAKFCRIMKNASRGWVMAPGNHDGYFFGNEHRSKTNSTWMDACRNAGHPLTKDRFIRYYLAALIGQKTPEATMLREYMQISESDAENLVYMSSEKLRDLIPDTGDWLKTGEEATLLHAVVWDIDRKKPWKSYIVQRLVLDKPNPSPADPSIGGILVDTCQYRYAPKIFTFPFQPAGQNGQVLGNQLDVIRKWVTPSQSPPGDDQSKLKRGKQSGDLWILMGHHPFNAILPSGQKGLEKIRESSWMPLYFSAHTHDGNFIIHETGDDSWLELNIGSILDWPLEYRTFAIGRRDEGGGIYLRSPRFSAQEELTARVSEKEEKWQVTQNDDDYYLCHAHIDTFSAEETEVLLKNALLATHLRMLKEVPTEGCPTEPCARPDDDAWPIDPRSEDNHRVASDGELAELIEAAMAGKHDALDEFHEKVDLLLALEEFENSRLQKAWEEDSDDYRNFRFVQAIWASKYDAARARRPWQDDWFIALPKE